MARGHDPRPQRFRPLPPRRQNHRRKPSPPHGAPSHPLIRPGVGRGGSIRRAGPFRQQNVGRPRPACLPAAQPSTRHRPPNADQAPARRLKSRPHWRRAAPRLSSAAAVPPGLAYEPGASRLTLGGRPLDEPYVKDGDSTAGAAGPFSVTVPQGRVFLLGDNRGNSADSRYRMRTTPGGTVPVTQVLGVALPEKETLRTGVLYGSLIIAGVLALLASAALGFLWLAARRRRPAVQGPVWEATTVERADPPCP
ncbi:S26 family signal peptidase [Streptomyces sp. NPDC048387]|uniref:S26 family signal peptidase n=1 Tax=Streptomyces sp. NPDC048387 TaxID=3365542 RepID=UPI00371B20CF